MAQGDARCHARRCAGGGIYGLSHPGHARELGGHRFHVRLLSDACPSIFLPYFDTEFIHQDL